ncbi:hypothetical protein EVAR_32882_1 [Eumeta japonica]|uniref:Ig-like domain-containing protein n=1 Tax=Eumeta variegata TaxID=151549 RepID=A0A4C1VQX4_EUMVA|nr:hypothetical protein EVAR_32882_1 [Eumeta japonica]
MKLEKGYPSVSCSFFLRENCLMNERYDTRVLQPHWSDEPLTGRAHWLPSPQSSLRVQAVAPRDRAVYRCRVDFQVSPTRNYKIALDVVAFGFRVRAVAASATRAVRGAPDHSDGSSAGMRNITVILSKNTSTDIMNFIRRLAFARGSARLDVE